MAIGKVKWFNAGKGYGFISADDGSADVFLHITALEKAGLNGIEEGQKIYYEVTMSKDRSSASQIRLLDDDE